MKFETTRFHNRFLTRLLTDMNNHIWKGPVNTGPITRESIYEGKNIFLR